MPGDASLLIVSNRLPVRVERTADGFAYEPVAGGLATSLQSLRHVYRLRWLGWPGLPVENETERATIAQDLSRRLDAVPIFLPAHIFDAYYEGFANGTLWPLFHYFPQHAHYDADEWEAYRRVNELFRDRIVEIIAPNDVVWIHDYHLLLLPHLVRAALPKARIGFFLHIPFPSSEIFRLLPWREEILRGLLGADLVGFQTHGHARHFHSSLLHLLGIEQAFDRVAVDDRIVRTDTFPIGVDVGWFAKAIERPEVRHEVQRLRAEASGRTIILTVDRLDFTKGIPERLRVFERFLERNPQWHNRVVLVALTAPSRTSVPEYRALKRTVDELVGRVNGRFGEPGWVPVWYLYRSLPLERVVALYRVASIAMVTPLRDGMNLVAKEYLASRPEGTGVLILSETAGAAEELGEALIVNPLDTEQACRALEEAMAMPEAEQRRRNEIMSERQRRYDVTRWAAEFLTHLEPEPSEGLDQVPLTGEVRERLLGAYRASDSRVLFLDYDGTMVPFAPRPQDAVPDEQLLVELTALSADPKNTVVIISGRDRETLESWLGAVGAELVAEHGAVMRCVSDASWVELRRGAAAGWKTELRPVLDTYIDRTPGAMLEEKAASLAWHYRQAGPELGTLRARQLLVPLKALIANTALVLMQGNKVVEVRESGFGKGRAAELYLRRHPAPDFVLATGDDPTGEELFEVMPPDAWTILVGTERQSDARYSLRGPDSMRRLLRALAGLTE